MPPAPFQRRVIPYFLPSVGIYSWDRSVEAESREAMFALEECAGSLDSSSLFDVVGEKLDNLE